MTTVVVDINETTDTITRSRTNKKSLGVPERKNPCSIIAIVKKPPLIAYAAGGLSEITRDPRYIPRVDHATPNSVPARTRMRASTIVPKRRPGCPKTVVIAARYAALPIVALAPGIKHMLTLKGGLALCK